MDLAQSTMGRYFSPRSSGGGVKPRRKGRDERVDRRIVAMAPERGAPIRVKGAIYRALDRSAHSRAARRTSVKSSFLTDAAGLSDRAEPSPIVG